MRFCPPGGILALLPSVGIFSVAEGTTDIILEVYPDSEDVGPLMATPRKKSTKAPEEPVEKVISLVWVGLDGMPVRAVNNTVCQVHDGLFIVSFGFTNPPLFAGTAKEIRAQIEATDAVPVTSVARIAVTEAHMEKVIKAFQDTLNRHRKQKDSEKK